SAAEPGLAAPVVGRGVGPGACGGEMMPGAKSAPHPRLRATLGGEQTSGVSSLAFSPNGKLLAAAHPDDLAVRLWDVASGKEKATLQGHTDRVWSVAFRSGGQLLASGSYDRTVKLWDVTTGKKRATLKGAWEA